MPTESTVYVVDDDEAMRAALRRLLESVGLPVETFATAAAFLETAQPSWAGCAVLDLRMPEIDGLELQARLRDAGIRLPIIMISAHGEVDSAVLAMKHGAIDFLRKPYQPAVLIARIREAFDADARRRAAEARQAAREEALARLTPREREVFDYFIEGRTSKQIALQLGLSSKTVDIHRAHILLKLQVSSVVDLVRLFPPPGSDGPVTA